MALTDAEIEAGFKGLADWLGEVEALLAAHTPDTCITAAQITAVAVPGETLTTTLANTMEQVTLAASDPRFAAYPAAHLLERLVTVRDSWELLLIEHHRGGPQ